MPYLGNTFISPEDYHEYVKRGGNQAPTALSADVEARQRVESMKAPSWQGSQTLEQYNPALRRHTEEDFAQGLNLAMPTADEEAIRREAVRKRMQGTLDAINLEYNTLRAQAAERGKSREERMRSVVENKGLGGSGRGETKRTEMEEITDEELANVEKMRRAKVQEAEGVINTQAQAEIEAERAKMQGNAEKFLSIMQGIRKDSRDQALAIGKAGGSLKDLSPEAKQNLLTRGGFTDDSDLQLYIDSAREPKDQIKYEFKIAGNKLFGFGTDPITGDLKTIEKEIPAEFAEKDTTWKPQVVEGELWAFDESTGTAEKIGGPGKKPETGTTDLTEYAYAKDQGYTGSFLDWQRDMANLKAKAAGGAGGLTPGQTQSTINQIAGQFDNEPIVRNYNTVVEGYEYARSLANKKNPTSADDQGLIYAFAKAQDPNSAVREGEYTTVQKYSQSLAQTKWADLKRMAKNEPFLTAEARRNMVATIEAKYKTAKKNYENVYKEYQRRIGEVQSGKVVNPLTNYGAAFEEDLSDKALEEEFNQTQASSAFSPTASAQSTAVMAPKEQGFWAGTKKFLFGE